METSCFSAALKMCLGILVISFAFMLCQCASDPDEISVNNEPPPTTISLPENPQTLGDPIAGKEYLISGDYISSGVPYDLYLTVNGENSSNVLGRTGDNAILPPDFTAVDAHNGVRVVAANCMQCHAGYINGEFILGLGNANADFTNDQSGNVALLDLAVSATYGNASEEFEAYSDFSFGLKKIASHIVTETVGANPADQIAAVLATYRDDQTLEWLDEPAGPIPNALVPTDVPPWWVLKKKNAMFYTGIGRGDFAKYNMASSLLTMKNSDKAEEVYGHFDDVLAFIYSIEKPDYPEAIDQGLAADGAVLFSQNCASCHGTYGDDASYPNLLIPQASVGTDPMLASAYESDEYSYFSGWLNNGWFGQGSNPAQLVAEGGYVAQPLDGIWASAPYLHNGSVPTLEDLLKSDQRPDYWKRSFNNSDYDHTQMGWEYTTENGKTDKFTYDTNLPGYGNQGHIYGDHLSDDGRTAVLEYLKTL